MESQPQYRPAQVRDIMLVYNKASVSMDTTQSFLLGYVIIILVQLYLLVWVGEVSQTESVLLGLLHVFKICTKFRSFSL